MPAPANVPAPHRASGSGRQGAFGYRESGGRKLLATDMRVAFMLVNNARYRVFEASGVPREQANLLTWVLLVMVANRLHDTGERVWKARTAPSTGEVVVTAGLLREVARAVSGPVADTPLLGTLIAIAMIGRPIHRAMSRGMHGLRGGSDKLYHGFRHRYGYLLDPGNLRLQRARRRDAKKASD
jgi:hypothetical protein